MTFDNRVTRLLGVDIPIVQAPMGYIAKPRLVSAVANAGAIGLVPGSLGIDEVREDIRRTRDLTDKQFGVNLPIAFVKDIKIVDMILAEGITFVTTSAGSPDKLTTTLKDGRWRRRSRSARRACRWGRGWSPRSSRRSTRT